MLKIAFGTTSKYKNDFLKELLEDCLIDAKVYSCEVQTGVKSQPRDEKETLTGSINRAKSALQNFPEAEIGLGVEIGYEPVRDKWYMHGWATVADREGNIYSEQSSTLELPLFFYKFMTEQDEVGHHVVEYEQKSNDKTWKYFSQIIKLRKPFIVESIRNVLLKYYFKEEYN